MSTRSSDLSVERSALNVERSGAAGSAVDSANPWLGLASFTEESRAFFHGRDEEIAELSRRVQRKLLTVLFGQSGLGKTSILRAGVVPRLRNEGYCPVYVRVDYGPGAPPPAEQIKQAVLRATADAGTWTRPEASVAGETLWEFLHHRDDVLRDASGRTLTPLIIFDQFEEIFTLGQSDESGRERAAQFKEELADLVENRAPGALEEKLEHDDTIIERYDFSRSDYRILISLREDYLPHLDTLKGRMPSITQNRMRLARMTGTQALEAVVKPGGALVTADVARAIVEFVAGARGGSVERLAEIDVEPPLLSVICRELNDRRRALDQPQITAEMVTGNRREILTDFYERSVADLPEPMRRFVEDKLLTKSGFRDNLALETALEEPGVTKPLIDTLVSRRLLRLEDRLGTQRVELTHDVLAEVIRASRDARQQRLAIEKERQRERLTRRRMWLARTIAAGLLVVCTAVSWIAWRAFQAERAQVQLRSEADAARTRETQLRRIAEDQELKALRKAYAADMNGVQHALATDNLGRARELLYRHIPVPGQVDLRDWEWRYLWQFCQSDAQEVITPPNDDSMMSVSASGDGKWLAVGSGLRGRLSLLNLLSGEKAEVPAGAGNVYVAGSPISSHFAVATASRLGASAAGANNVMLWDPESKQIIRKLDLNGPSFGLAFSENGQTVAILEGGVRPRIVLWRVTDDTVASWPVKFRSGRSTIFSRFAVTRDLSMAALETDAETLSLVDLKTGHEQSIPFGSGTAALAFSPDGSTLAFAGSVMDQTSPIVLWDVKGAVEIGRLNGHRGRVGQMEFLTDGKRLVSGAADQTLRLWDLPTRTCIRTFRGHKTEVWRLTVLPDQRTLVSGCKDGSVYKWDLNSSADSSANGAIDAGALAWGFAGDGETLITVEATGQVAKWNGRGFREKTPLLALGTVLSAVVDPHRPQIAVTNRSRIQIWDWQRRVMVRELTRDPQSAARAYGTSLFFSPDGKRLSIAGIVGTQFSFAEWDLETGDRLREYKRPASSTSRPSGAYSHDGMQYVSVSFPEGNAQLFDLRTGESTDLDVGLREPGPSPSFSITGDVVLIPSIRGYLAKVDLKSKEVVRFEGYMFGVHAGAFSPDGRRILSGGSAHEAVVLWDAASRERTLTLGAKGSVFAPVAFSPEGQVLAAGGDPLNFWRAPTWDTINKSEAEATQRASSTKE